MSTERWHDDGPTRPAGTRITQHVNMADVARAVGVSISTVSRALSGKPGVSAAMRDLVRAKAAELSYVVSADASALARRSTHRVGVVVPHIDSWFFSTMLAAIEGLLRRAELDVLIYQVEGAADRERFFERLPTRRKVDAVIVVALPVTEQQVARLALLGVHVVVAGGRLGDHPHVRVDDVEVGRRAVQHLLDLGHRRIAMIRSHDHEGVVWPADRERTVGYRLALRQAGVELGDDLLLTAEWGVQGGRDAMAELLRRRPPPSAVFAYSDEMAFGVLDQLRRSGVAVPEEMSVLGVDGHPMAGLHDLTTVRQPVQQQGAAAAQMTLDLLEGRRPGGTAVELPTELVVRGTTGPADAVVTTAATRG